MPLRDHFHPPLKNLRRWEGVHGLWPAVIVQRLLPQLPEGYYAEPRVRLGVNFEVDVGTIDARIELDDASGGVATQAAVAPSPTWTWDADLAEFDEYEVHVYDGLHTLVAAIEIVSPGNKDRPDAREAFTSKVAALLRRGVCVSVVDVVTEKNFNLYADAIDLVGLSDPTVGDPAPGIYAATIRKRWSIGPKATVDSWFFPLIVGALLPTIPLWLDDQASRSIDLEASYEETCRTLRIE